MSLKAKLEAVIYAAEEPVTLAQLAVLFAADALEWKAEQEAASASDSPGTPEAAASQSFLDEQFAYPGPDEEAAAADSSAETVSNSDSATDPEADRATSPAAGSDLAEAAEAELEARRQARLRDREVREILRPLLDELIASCASDDRGVEIREVAGGFRMATKPEYHDAVRLFVKSIKQPLKLSLPALETLAVIAYKQPVTAPEVNEIRGVDSSAVFGTLLSRKLITTAGRKAVLGRPILYKTTREFLLRFGLRDVSELPSMEEFEKLAALEFEEQESATAEYSEQEANPELSLEFDSPDGADSEDSPDESLEPESEPK